MPLRRPPDRQREQQGTSLYSRQAVICVPTREAGKPIWLLAVARSTFAASGLPAMSKVIDFPVAGTSDLDRHMARATRYRLRASQISSSLEQETDDERVQTLLSLALSWIQLAENEEWLGVVNRA
ncbi:MAG: hypothetical protein ABWY14_02610 [Tardiphaga sp.]